MEHLTVHAWTFSTAGSLGVIANSAQLILTSRDKNWKESAFGSTLLSFNIADLLASIATCLLGIKSFMFIHKMIDSALFTSLRIPVVIALIFSITSSITHVALIAVQRVIAVAYPFRVRQILTKKRCYITLSFVWVISIALAIIVPFASKLGHMSLAGVGIAIGITLMMSYSVVCSKTMRQNRRNVVNNASENMQRRRRQSEKEVLIYSVAVTIVYIVCIYPSNLDHFISFPAYLHYAGDVMLSINPLLDTLLYFMFSYCKRRKERARANAASRSNFEMRSARNASFMTTRVFKWPRLMVDS